MRGGDDLPNNNQKIKLLLLYRFLYEETDENHAVTTKEICSFLEDNNISCDRRTLTKDIQLLNEYGYEVFTIKYGRQNAYYVDDSIFSMPELKIIINAMEAAEFINESTTEKLIRKIAYLGGKYQAEEILNGHTKAIKTKHSNKKIYYSIYTIEKAIEQNKRISFFYFDLDVNAQKVYRKDKQIYTTEPLAIVQDKDNCYLVSYNEKYNNKTHYRVDRMEQVEMLNSSISSIALKEKKTLSLYKNRVFSMYSGEEVEVTLEFAPSLLGTIYDKFGEQINVIKCSNGWMRIMIPIEISPTFFGWLFQFAGSMRVIKPKNVADMYIQRAEKIINEQK